MRGHNIRYYAELTKNYPNYHQILLIWSSVAALQKTVSDALPCTWTGLVYYDHILNVKALLYKLYKSRTKDLLVQGAEAV